MSSCLEFTINLESMSDSLFDYAKSSADVHDSTPEASATQLVPVVSVIRSLSTATEVHPTELLARTQRAERKRVFVRSTLGAIAGAYLAFVHIAALLHLFN